MCDGELSLTHPSSNAYGFKFLVLVIENCMSRSDEEFEDEDDLGCGSCDVDVAAGAP